MLCTWNDKCKSGSSGVQGEGGVAVHGELIVNRNMLLAESFIYVQINVFVDHLHITPSLNRIRMQPAREQRAPAWLAV